MLELPKTLRLAKKGETPSTPSIIARIEQAERANITEGYKLVDKDQNNLEHKDIPFKFYAEINIDNSRLWKLILELTNELPEKASLLFGHADAETNYGRYMSKHDLLMDLSKFKKELTQDTFIEWGLIYNDKNSLIEIFITETKYIKFWGVDKESFKSKMGDTNLNHVDNIEFVDEYPRIREALFTFDDKILMTSDLIEEFKRLFTD